MSFRRAMQVYQTVWMFASHAQQVLVWNDAAQARIARAKAEARAKAQLKAMLAANPSGQLGKATLNDKDALKKSGLL